MIKCYYTERLLKKLVHLNSIYEGKICINLINQAISYAKKCHEGQFRNSGEPYYTHPLEVAYMVADYCIKTDVLVTAILHDTIEDTEATKYTIADLFGMKIAQNVVDLTRIKENDTKITSAELVDNLFEEKKYDLLLVKQFDRLHNMKTLGAKSPEKKQKTIKETVYAFIVLSAYLGLRNVEEEISFLCSNTLKEQSYLNSGTMVNFRDEM